MGKKVLAVDDSESMRRMVLFTLNGAGYEVVQACDGLEALELARHEPVDLVLTDVHMPRMDGITLVRELRELPAYKFTPMLILTTESSQEKKMDGKRAGRIAFAPWRLDLGEVAAGRHDLALTAFGSRINTFGQIHNSVVNYKWWGPSSFRTTGDQWSDEYVLRPQGILTAPQIEHGG